MNKENNNASPLESDLLRYRKPSHKGLYLKMLLPAAVLATVLFLALPFFNVMSGKKKKMIDVRSVESIEVLPPPPVQRRPPPPPPKKKIIEPKPLKVHKPKLATTKPQKTKKMILPIRLSALSIDIPSDTNLDFDIGQKSAEGVDVAVEEGVDTVAENEPKIHKLSELDSLPKLLNRVLPKSPFAARQQGIDGRVVISFTVTRDGLVDDIVIDEMNPGTLFKDAALKALKRWKFSPGKKDNKAVAVRMRQSFIFKNK